MKNPLKFAEKIGKAVESASNKKPLQKDQYDEDDSPEPQQEGMTEHCPNCGHPLKLMKPAKKGF